MLLSFVRPMACSCVSTARASHAGEIVEVLLHDDVAASGERRILRCHRHRLAGAVSLGILGAVDEAEQVALIEGLEAVDLVDHGRRAPEALGQPLGELEAQIRALGPNVKQQVSGRARSGVHRSLELRATDAARPAGVRRTRRSHSSDPTADHAGQLRLGHAEADRASDRSHVAQHVADLGLGAGRGLRTRKMAAAVGSVTTTWDSAGDMAPAIVQVCHRRVCEPLRWRSGLR